MKAKARPLTDREVEQFAHQINSPLLDRFLATIEAKNASIREWSLALQSLTPGGSEYVDDPARCVAFVRETRYSQHAAIVKLKKSEKGTVDADDQCGRDFDYAKCTELRGHDTPAGGYSLHYNKEIGPRSWDGRHALKIDGHPLRHDADCGCQNAIGGWSIRRPIDG